MRRGVRTRRGRLLLVMVVMVGSGLALGAGAVPATSAPTVTSAGVSGALAGTSGPVDLSACSHRITHRKHLTRKQIQTRKRRWHRLCRAARAAAQQQAQQAAAQQAARQAAYTASVSPTSAPTKACGSVRYPKADGTRYTCSFSDEFSGSSLDSTTWSPVLTAVTGQRSGTECDVDTPDTLAVGGEVLTITARRLATPMTCDSPYGAFDTSYTGGMITTYRKYAQAYGRFEMRARFPQATVAGLQSSLWMYPQTLTYGAWPNSGEIDIAEWFSGWGDLVVPHLHYNGDSTDPYRGSYSCKLGDPAAFHTFAVEWTPMSITFVYDGQTCLRDSTWSPLGGLLAPAPFDQPFNLLIGNGRGTGNNAPTADTPFPSTLQVDYVRAWS